ncbi:hypothetical protein AB0D38_09965 [Streptomyces sp. NPDC048279]|uniref:hypothetical protein n=1 Tax=Streptomyces sp. NPDC048279 TaxID=3154714 RepID=UPI0034487057
MTRHPPAPRSRSAAPAPGVAWQQAHARPQEHRAPPTALAAYTAFRERHYEPYLQYAALRIGRRQAAERAVTAAFTELAVSWTVVLGSAGPAAVAWRILHDHVDRALGRGPAAGQAVQTLQHDANFLHEQMHLSSDRIAEVLGIHPSDVPSLLFRPTKG